MASQSVRVVMRRAFDTRERVTVQRRMMDDGADAIAGADAALVAIAAAPNRASVRYWSRCVHRARRNRSCIKPLPAECGAGMAIPRGTPCACQFSSGRVFAGFRIYPGSVRFILVITTNPDNLSLYLCVYLPTARFFPQRGDGGGTAARCAAQRWGCF